MKAKHPLQRLIDLKARLDSQENDPQEPSNYGVIAELGDIIADLTLDPALMLPPVKVQFKGPDFSDPAAQPWDCFKPGDTLEPDGPMSKFRIGQVVIQQVLAEPTVEYDILFFNNAGTFKCSIRGLWLPGSGKPPVCHKCGKPMVKRYARASGNPFWGCSGYPGCQTIQNCVDGTPPRAPQPESEQARLAKKFDKAEAQRNHDIMARRRRQETDGTVDVNTNDDDENMPF